MLNIVKCQDSIIFGSKDEANLYLHLKDKRDKGEIKDFALQYKLKLSSESDFDFVVFNNDGTESIIQSSIKNI